MLSEIAFALLVSGEPFPFPLLLRPSNNSTEHIVFNRFKSVKRVVCAREYERVSVCADFECQPCCDDDDGSDSATIFR